jgi:beta-mannosidase
MHHDWSVRHARPAKVLPWELWVVSSKTTEVVADFGLRFISISTGKDIGENHEAHHSNCECFN